MAMEDSKIIKIVQECFTEAEQGKRSRARKNEENWRVYLGQHDWSHKEEDQSTEFLPKLSTAAEQMSALVKRGLVGFGDWFSAKAPSKSPISGSMIREVLKRFLREVYVGNGQCRDFSVVMSDAVKNGLLESLIILKVHGSVCEEDYLIAPQAQGIIPEPQEPLTEPREIWKLRIDVVPADEFYPDPTGSNLYRIHHMERDLSHVIEMAESGLYDEKEVKKLKEDFVRTDADRPRASQKNQNEATKPSFRKKVVIDEFWGTILNEDGTVAHRNVLCAVANGKYLIRKPEPWPYWHGEDPFVVAPLLRVPGSTWHKAVYDHAASLNIALNEMYNLLLDGAMGAVWGVKQLRPDMLDDPTQVSNGIPPGMTLVLAEGAPTQQLALESCITPAIPTDAMQIYQLTDKEFNASAFTNDMKMGFLPQRQVKATEIQNIENNTAMTFDGIIGDLEHEIIEKVLKKVWMLLLQNADDLAPDDVVEAVGVDAAFALSKLTPAQRYRIFGGYNFEVSGLSSTLAKARDFQKMTAFMQVVGANPLLLQAFFMKYTPDKVLEYLMKTLNINPLALQQTPEDQVAMQARMQALPMFMNMMQGGMQQGSLPVVGGGGSTLGGDSGLNGEIHQNAEPTGGF